MEDLTLDVCVLMSGSGIGNKNYEQMCADLMEKMLAIPNYKLALDKKGYIANQYQEKVGKREGTLGHHFFIKMVSSDRTVSIPWRNLNNAIRVRLENRGFTRDNEDYKYVICASGTCCNKLVSHDLHFFNACNILRSIPVRVLWPNQT